MKSIINDYNIDELYNINEVALFYCALGNKSFGTNNFKGTKDCKDRISLALLVDATCTNKFKLVGIGKAKNPRAFANWNYKNEIIYYSNKKGWITSLICFDYMKKFEDTLTRPSLVILDNFSGHYFNQSQFTKLRFLFLHPNTTSVFQPIAKGIGRSFKYHYRKALFQGYVSDFELGHNFQKINIKEALIYVKIAWNTITGKVIQNCWIDSTLVHKEGYSLYHLNSFEKDENINLLDEVAYIYNNLFNEDISVLDKQEDEDANEFTTQIANLPGSSVTDIVKGTKSTIYERENSENIGNNYTEAISTHSGEIKRVIEQY